MLQKQAATLSNLVSVVATTKYLYSVNTLLQDWWPMVSLGLLNYDMSRTHSIMRIATTASPISGAEVLQLEQWFFSGSNCASSAILTSCLHCGKDSFGPVCVYAHNQGLKSPFPM